VRFWSASGHVVAGMAKRIDDRCELHPVTARTKRSHTLKSVLMVPIRGVVVM